MPCAKLSKSIAERYQLYAFITLATTALNHHRPDEPVENKTDADDILFTLQHLTTLLTTDTLPGTKHPSRDPAGNRLVAVTATTSSQHINTLITVTRNTREKLSSSGYRMQSLKGDVEGKCKPGWWIERKCVTFNIKSVTGHCDEHHQRILTFLDVASPDMYFENLFAVIERFRQSQYDPKLRDDDIRDLKKKFHLFVINHTFPQIVARILKGNQFWKNHPIDVLAAAPLHDLRAQLSFPKKIKVHSNFLVNWLLAKHIAPDIRRTNGASFEVTPDTIDLWAHVVADAFVGLKTALIDEGSECKSSLELDDVVEALNQLLALRALLKCGIVEYLLSSEELTALMNEPFSTVDVDHGMPLPSPLLFSSYSVPLTSIDMTQRK